MTGEFAVTWNVPDAPGGIPAATLAPNSQEVFAPTATESEPVHKVAPDGGKASLDEADGLAESLAEAEGLAEGVRGRADEETADTDGGGGSDC